MGFNDQTIIQIWNKGTTVEGKDSNIIRKDQCGAWIKLSEYGNRDSEHGWEIDHIQAASKGGSDSLINLRPLHWQNNLKTSDGRLQCPIKAR